MKFSELLFISSHSHVCSLEWRHDTKEGPSGCAREETSSHLRLPTLEGGPAGLRGLGRALSIGRGGAYRGGPALGTRPASLTEGRNCGSPPCVPGLPTRESHLLLGRNSLDELHNGAGFSKQPQAQLLRQMPPHTAPAAIKSSGDGGFCLGKRRR